MRGPRLVFHLRTSITGVVVGVSGWGRARWNERRCDRDGFSREQKSDRGLRPPPPPVAERRRPNTELRQSACGLPALIAHWAAKARLYAGRASPRAM
jgi:hypothetical protein